MKAGIYKLFDGGLVYVRKDRTVSAIAGTEYPVQTGVKAQTFEGGKSILITTGKQQFHGDRHADVPNGCTDHQALVDSMHMAANLEPGERVVDYGTKFARVEEIDNPADVARAIVENCAKALGVDHESFDKAAEELAKPVTDDEFDRIKAEADDPYKRFAQTIYKGETGRYYSGGVVPQDGDILIEFEDNGQDFLRWTLRDDAEGYTRVIDSQPFQRDVWAGMIVHNADTLVRGRVDVAYVGRDAEDSRNLLHRVVSAKRVKIGKLQMLGLDTERRFVGVPPALAAPYGETDLVEWRRKFAASLRSQGFRICHTRSARKHKKQGHTVIPLHGGWYAWRPADYLQPYQRDALARFVSDERITIKVPVSVGKSEVGPL